MESLHLEICNALMGPKESSQDFLPVPIQAYRDKDKNVIIRTFWKPSPEELIALNKGMPIMLSIMDNKLPPVKMEILNAEIIEGD